MTIAILAKLKISYWLIDVKRIIFIVLACEGVSGVDSAL